MTTTTKKQTSTKKEKTMKTSPKITTFAAITLVLLGQAWLPASQPAEPTQTYHGTITSGEFLCDMTPVPGPTVTGNWNVNIDPRTPAQVTLNIFYDGGHHLAFGYNALMLVSYSGGVYVFSGFGDQVTVTLDTNQTPATFSWHVQFSVCSPQRPYNSLSYLGVASR
jgi:hypothetical protein